MQLGASEMPFLAAVPREEWDDAFHDYYGDWEVMDCEGVESCYHVIRILLRAWITS